VIIECPNCHSKYQYDEERFERKPAKRIKCARCQQIFEIHNPAFAPREAAAAPGETTGTAKKKDRHEETQMKKAVPVDTTEQSPLPQKDTGQKQTLQLPAGKRLSLAILDGPDAGTVHRIEKPRTTIGRSSADITLNDTEASRQHAALEVRETLYTVTDLGSTNGTFVGGEKVTAPVELHDKAEFQVGATTLMLIVTDDA
jgi:predicted Zn finger-like uncharacterized protein